MYEFRSPTGYAYPEELSLQTIVDGINLDKKIDGFRTLSVKGRELNSKDISMTTHQTERSGGGNRTKSKGAAFVTSYDSGFIGSRTTDKIITVEYDLKASCNHDFRRKFELLNYYLMGDEMEVIFTDDEDFSYIATLGGVTEVSSNGNWTKGSFEIVCSNAFKRRVDPEIFHFTDKGDFKKHSLYPVLLETAEIVIQTSTEKVILKNETTGKRIIIDGDFKSGDLIIFDFVKSYVHTGKGQSLMTGLDITSHLESFTMSQGDSLSISPSGDVYMRYREVRL